MFEKDRLPFPSNKVNSPTATVNIRWKEVSSTVVT